MKSKLLLILLFVFISCCKESENIYAQSVPNTETFSLLDVYNVIHGHTPTTTVDLNSCIANAIYGYYDQTWYNYYPANSLLRFRNYTVGGVNPCTLSVGDPYDGGIIAYYFVSGDPGYVSGQCHGIIVSTSDLSTGAVWGCWPTNLPGASGTAIGTGLQNTTDIITGCSTSGISAKLCYDYSNAGYTDWFLPSKDEIAQVYLNRAAIGGLSTAYFSTSSEIDSYSAWEFNFETGSAVSGSNSKLIPLSVRAIRYF